jgi:hypothetical protein
MRAAKSMNDISSIVIDEIPVLRAQCHTCGKETRSFGWRKSKFQCTCAGTNGISVSSDNSGVFHRAAMTGNKSGVVALLASRAFAVDHRDADGITPFAVSVLASQFKV